MEDACLLCSEDKPHHCHRRLVTEFWERHGGSANHRQNVRRKAERWRRRYQCHSLKGCTPMRPLSASTAKTTGCTLIHPPTWWSSSATPNGAARRLRQSMSSRAMAPGVARMTMTGMHMPNRFSSMTAGRVTSIIQTAHMHCAAPTCCSTYSSSLTRMMTAGRKECKDCLPRPTGKWPKPNTRHSATSASRRCANTSSLESGEFKPS